MTNNQRIAQLESELERLHSWDGLMELLDEHWPEDIFPTLPDRKDRDPGPRIVSLVRWVTLGLGETAQAERRALAAEARIEAVRKRAAQWRRSASENVATSDPDDPYIEGYADGLLDSARDVHFDLERPINTVGADG